MVMATDVFCKIIKGEIKSSPIFKDKEFVVIKDINPQAPVHLLIVSKKHFEEKSRCFAGEGIINCREDIEKGWIEKWI